MILAHVAGVPAEELLVGISGAGAVLLAVRVRLAALWRTRCR